MNHVKKILQLLLAAFMLGPFGLPLDCRGSELNQLKDFLATQEIDVAAQMGDLNADRARARENEERLSDEMRRRAEERESAQADAREYAAAPADDSHQALSAAIQSFGNSVQQGLQTYNEALQLRARVDEEIRQREQESRALQAENNRRALQAREEQIRLRNQREAERLANDRRERERRDAEVARQQEVERRQAERLAQQREQEEARRRREESGTWEQGDFKVTCWGSDKLYLASFVYVVVTDAAGEPKCNGTYLRISNRYQNKMVYYSVANSGHTNRTLAPQQQVLVPLSFSQPPVSTTAVIRVRYWKD